jgi:DNA-binding SARP family transcriptional activator
MTEPASSQEPAGPAYRARLFGSFRFETDQGEAPGPLGRKTRALLAYLLLAGRDPVSRETLAGLLWGDRGEEQARGSLRYALHELRGLALGDAPLLSINRTHVQVRGDRIETDLDRLRSLSDGSDAEAFVAVLGDQPGELLGDLSNVDAAFDDWLVGERIRRQDERRGAAITVAQRALAAGSATAARAVATRLLAAEPTDELATQLAMEASSRLGDRDGVRLAFAHYAEALRRELQAVPPVEMISLRDRLAAATSPTPQSEGRPGGPIPGPRSDPPKADRRALMVGGAAAVAVLGVGLGAALWTRRSSPPASAQSAELLRQALLASGQDTRDGQKQAIGLLRHAVAEQPDFADGWGALATTYAFAAHWRTPEEAADMRARARAAADRAQGLAPRNALAEVARAILLPSRGNWLVTERTLRRSLAEHPEHGELAYALAQLLTQVGRAAEAAPIFQRMRRSGPPNPGVYYREIYALWTANRREEAERLIEAAFQLFPSQFAIWFARLYIFMFIGRTAEVMAMLNDTATHPTNIPISEFSSLERVAKAMQTRARGDVSRAMDDWLAYARTGAGFAENALQFASALGRLDEAFAVAEAYYFGTGFAVPDVRFAKEQGTYTPLEERQTNLLFFPVTAPMRRDARFQPLVERLGLADYWRKSGTKPDYLRTA